MNIDLVIIDDEDVVRSSLVKLVETLGFSVIGCSTGEDFLALKLDAGCTPCVIADLHLLGGMDAFQIKEALTARGDHWPMILLTGGADENTDRLAERSGVCEVLHKPVTRDTLLAAIERNVDKKAI